MDRLWGYYNNGCYISEGAIIGVGVVVKHDAKPYEIVCGVQEKPIKRRFIDENIKKMI